MDGLSPVAEAASSCPHCKTILTGEGNSCDRCGFTMAGVPVYDPKHFFWLALLLSAMVPIYLSAMNWGRIGRTRTKRLWLGFGMLGFFMLFVCLYLLPAVSAHVSRSLGYVINLPIAFALREIQRPVFRTALRLGAVRGSTFKGTLVGMGLVVVVYALATGAIMARTDFVFRRGEALFAQGKYAAAADMFVDTLKHNPEEAAAVYNLALCNYRLRNWPEAARGFEQYLQKDATDASCWALLFRVRSAQGRHDEADSLATRAEELEPGILNTLFGEEEGPTTHADRVPQDRL